MPKLRVRPLPLLMLLLAASLLLSNIANAVEIGQHYGGGIVVAKDSSGKHGLIAARVELEYSLEATPTAVCANYTVVSGGKTYNDWYLPTAQKMNAVYYACKLTHQPLKGNFYFVRAQVLGASLLGRMTIVDEVGTDGTKKQHNIVKMCDEDSLPPPTADSPRVIPVRDF